MKMMDRTALLDAYLRTEYRVDGPPSFSIHIGKNHPVLDLYLEKLSFATWTFITAENPQSRPLAAEINSIRTHNLAKRIQQSDWHHLPGRGIPEDNNWEPENSFLICGISLEEAMSLAREFDQNAIVYGTINKMSELIWLDGDSAGFKKIK